MIGLVLIPVLVLLLVLPAARWARSRRRDERSIEAHRSTLGVIEHAAGVDEQPERWRDRSAAHVRIVGSPAADPRPAEETKDWQPAARRSLRPSFPSRKEPTLQPAPVPVVPGHPAAMNRDVARLLATRARSAAAAIRGRDGADTRLATRPRRYSTEHHLPVVLASVAVALVMAAIIGVALGSHRGPASHPPASAAPPVHHQPASTPPQNSTTTPPAPSVVATSGNSSYAAYAVNATGLDVELVAALPCWVELRDGTASGPVVFEGTIRSGLSQVFHAVGAIWLRLGDPAGVRMTIDGSPVALPATSNPFDVTVTSPAGA